MRNTDIGQKIAIGVLIVLLLAFTGGFIYYHFRGKAPEKGRETQESISSSETSSTSDTSASLVSRQSWTAELVAAWLKDEMEPDIGEVVVYTAQTDPDQLMGLPNQYRSKVRFEDLRLVQPENLSECVGGEIKVFDSSAAAQKHKKQIEKLANGESKPVILINDTILLHLSEQFSLEMLSAYSTTFMELPSEPPEGLKLVNPVYLNRESNLFKTVTDSYSVTVEREYHGIAYQVPASWVYGDDEIYYPSNEAQITLFFLTSNPYPDYVFWQMEKNMENVEERLKCKMFVGENVCEYKSIYHISDNRMYQSDMVLFRSKREDGHVAFCLTQPVTGAEDYTSDFFQLLESCTVLGYGNSSSSEESTQLSEEGSSWQTSSSASNSSSDASSKISLEELLEIIESLSQPQI